MPFDKEDRSGIVYVWVGNRADPEEARITEEIAREMYDGVRKKQLLQVTIISITNSEQKELLLVYYGAKEPCD